MLYINNDYGGQTIMAAVVVFNVKNDYSDQKIKEAKQGLVTKWRWHLETFGYSGTQSKQNVQIIGLRIRMIAQSVGLLKTALWCIVQ